MRRGGRAKGRARRGIGIGVGGHRIYEGERSGVFCKRVGLGGRFELDGEGRCCMRERAVACCEASSRTAKHAAACERAV